MFYWDNISLFDRDNAMSNSIWFAVGLVLIVEGLGPLIAPNGWRKMVAELSQQPNNQLRRIGGCLVVAGGIIAYYFAS
ncbi:Putative inner membrane protein YjeT (clustered with HflC) [Vibrio aestuarianus]|nr:Putative inner membrane protein YjeT (clustered with HflC) [Vibrio aestuarianus]